MKTKKVIFLKTVVLLLLAVFITGITLNGCKKKQNPPSLPPSNSFAIDFSDFNSSKSMAKGVDTAYTNKGIAVANVGFWNLVLTLNLIVPVASFAESFKHQAEQQSNGSWQWSYSFLLAYTAKLNGKVENGNVYWNMYVSKANEFSDFLWYSGVSAVNNTSGTWRLYKSPADPIAYIDIAWHKNTDANTFDIQYTNVIPNDVENGAYISYGYNNNANYNSFYNIYYKSQDNLINIEWNRSSKEGHLKNPKYFNDSNWHCWNTAGIDVTCP